MENKVIVISTTELAEFLQPIMQKLDKMETQLSQNSSVPQKTFSDMEASRFLKVSKKKLQQLRNDRKIGFIRENDGRRILYRYEHLMEYLQSNELKKKK